ncbi:MAG: YARHG domain-containing protein [Clostridia bacterium]|nr:YARHG domain-containing protein [Clostridia bacterium]
MRKPITILCILVLILAISSCGKDKSLPPLSLWTEKPPEYVLPDSSRKTLSKEDIAALNRGELELARMEILARHGYPFDELELRGYFLCQPWYEEKGGMAEPLSETELANHALITARQEDLALRVQPIELVNGAGVAYVEGVRRLAGLRSNGNNHTAEFGGAVYTFSSREMRPDGTIYIFTQDKTTFVALPSADHHYSLILCYGGKKLRKAGLIHAHPDDISLMEDGTFLIREYGGWLHDWKQSAVYILKKGKLIMEQTQQGCMWSQVTLREPLTVHTTPGDASTAWTLPAGAETNLLWCTEKGWVMLEMTSKGIKKTGWFHMRDPETMQDGRPGVSVFAGLNLVN